MPNLKINNKQYAGVNKAQFVDANTTQLVTFSHLEDIGTQEATSADIINGQAAYTPEGEKIVGTMPVNTKQTITLDVNNPEYIIPRGYHSGEGKVKIEPYVAKMVSSDIEQNLTADDGKVISSVEVKGISKEPAPMNIVYGLAAPGIADRDKLWVKTAQEPSEVIVNSDFNGTMEYEYNIGISPNNETWHGATAIAYEDKIFFCSEDLRFEGSGNVYEYNTNDNTYKVIGTCNKYYGCALFIVDDWLHVIGGSQSLDTTNQHYKYNVKTYERITCAPTSFGGSSYGAAIGHKIYLFGGRSEGSFLTDYTSAIKEYDVDLNVWRTVASFPQEFNGVIAAAIDKIIYFFYNNNLYTFDSRTYKLSDPIKTLQRPSSMIPFGTDIWLFYNQTITILDTLTLKTKELDVISSISSSCPRVKVLDDAIYICDHNVSRLNLYSTLPYNTLQLAPSLAENIFEIYPNFEIGVQNAYIGDSAGRSQWVNAYLYNTELQQWINIRTGLADETDAWQTGDSIYIVNAGVAEEDNETIIIEKGES